MLIKNEHVMKEYETNIVKKFYDSLSYNSENRAMKRTQFSTLFVIQRRLEEMEGTTNVFGNISISQQLASVCIHFLFTCACDFEQVQSRSADIQFGTFNSSKRSLKIRSSIIESVECNRSKVFSYQQEWGYHQ